MTLMPEISANPIARCLETRRRSFRRLATAERETFIFLAAAFFDIFNWRQRRPRRPRLFQSCAGASVPVRFKMLALGYLSIVITSS